ncbi:MAG: nucleoside triphosphate pyrophosphatase [Verrucomicrobiota bacterium]
MELILASSSPRRKDLLSEAGILFRASSPNVEEWSTESHPDLSPNDLALSNARLKADCIRQKNPTAVVLAADTIVYCKGDVLGKPNSRSDAIRMLSLLSNSTHEVITGMVWHVSYNRTVKEYIGRTFVTFKPLNEKRINEYIDRVNVMDKAGSYALQDRGEDIVERIEGSRTNVIGLPMEKVHQWWTEEYQSKN